MGPKGAGAAGAASGAIDGVGIGVGLGVPARNNGEECVKRVKRVGHCGDRDMSMT